MRALLIAITFGMVPHESVVTDTADVIEVNHYFDENGRLVFDQIIFWEWCDEKQRHQVFAWRFAKQPGQFPVRDWGRNAFVTTWYDRKLLRCVRGASVRETWTQYDPEVHDRSIAAQNLRRGLSRQRTLAKPQLAPPDHRP